MIYDKMGTMSVTDRDKRAIENMARTGMSFDDLRRAFKDFPIEEVENIYTRIRRDTIGDKPDASMKVNCS